MFEPKPCFPGRHCLFPDNSKGVITVKGIINRSAVSIITHFKGIGQLYLGQDPINKCGWIVVALELTTGCKIFLDDFLVLIAAIERDDQHTSPRAQNPQSFGGKSSIGITFEVFERTVEGYMINS